MAYKPAMQRHALAKVSAASAAEVKPGHPASTAGIASGHRFAATQTRVVHGGLPARLKRGIEHLSGMSMDDVKVHYNSLEPSTVGAHGYAQGNHIHLAPGQAHHLPHEAWHVVQQRRGIVRKTNSAGKIPINDDDRLESEADSMGSKALSISNGARCVGAFRHLVDQKQFHDQSGPAPHNLDSTPPTLGAGDVMPVQRVRIHVDQPTLDRLALAHSAIQRARQWVPHAGNQVDDIDESRGDSQARLQVARNRQAWVANQHAGLSTHQQEVLRAACAINAGGANCDEYAAISYTMLASNGGETTSIRQIPGHRFATLGNVAQPHTAALADAWVTQPRAHTLDSSIWGAGDEVVTYHGGQPDYSYQQIQELVDHHFPRLGSGGNAGLAALGHQTEQQRAQYWQGLQAPEPGREFRYGYQNPRSHPDEPLEYVLRHADEPDDEDMPQADE